MTGEEVPHPAEDLDPAKIDMLLQPFTTQEGYLNEACLQELEAKLKGIPESHERLMGNPEWSTPWVVTDTEIVGQLAHWAVRQFEGPPPDLAEVLGYLQACLRRGPFTEETAPGFRCERLSLCEVNKILWEILGGLRQFDNWNREEVVGERWIDLSALLHNVCVGIRDERRHELAFERRFEARHWEGS